MQSSLNDGSETKVQIFVPSESNGNIIDEKLHNQTVRYLLEEFSKLFQGATAQLDMIGGWHSPERGFVSERISIVTSYTHEDNLHMPELLKLVNLLKETMQQEAIFLKVGTTAYIL